MQRARLKFGNNTPTPVVVAAADRVAAGVEAAAAGHVAVAGRVERILRRLLVGRRKINYMAVR